MTATMKPTDGTSLQTRPSLLHRLNAGDDAQSWQDFYRIYGGLIRHFAAKAGLTPEEAEEVVQETAIGVARGLPHFVYDPKVCRFKTWLLNLTRWRIADQLRRRHPHQNYYASVSNRGGDETAELDRIPDPALPDFGGEWDAAFEKNLLARALECVRNRIDERQFQIFDLSVMKEISAAQVAKTLRVNIATVYLAKHRVSAAVKKEISRLQKQV
jgi:RNA polymerase sigma factor (sigma-70 family)